MGLTVRIQVSAYLGDPEPCRCLWLLKETYSVRTMCIMAGQIAHSGRCSNSVVVVAQVLLQGIILAALKGTEDAAILDDRVGAWIDNNPVSGGMHESGT